LRPSKEEHRVTYDAGYSFLFAGRLRKNRQRGEQRAAANMMKDKPAAECLRYCVKQRTKYALVVGKSVYPLEGHETELDKYAAQKVAVRGVLKGETLTVESVVLAK
jgi:hypothetical protein